MANNRLYLKSKRTGEAVYLAKYYPSSGWYTWPEVAEQLSEFLGRHSFGGITSGYAKAEGIKACGGNYDGGTMELEWEMDVEDDNV